MINKQSVNKNSKFNLTQENLTTVLKKTSLSLIMALGISSQSMAFNSSISFDQMTKDITSLASDDLKGRGNFSEEIDQAADYIADRFSEIGLKSFGDNKNFKQSFSLFQISPKSIAVSLNGVDFSEDALAIATNQEKISWVKSEQAKAADGFTAHVISKDDDMRKVLGDINKTGGEHLVMINTAHKDMFVRYRDYFNRGLIKNKVTEAHSLVMVLTDETTINALQLSATTSKEKRSLTNVVGVMPGKTSPDEVVIYSAHYDHLGFKTEDGKTAIYNGADDDASGTTAVINLAQYFTDKGDNARTLMFVAFTAEEIGGYGSKHFSQQLDPDSVTAMVNIEMIGKPSKFGAGQVWMTGMERSNLGELLNANLKSDQGKIHKDPYPEQGLFYRSDNATLARLGVPAHSFSSTQLDKDKHYHQTTDDLASLDLDSMHKVIESLASSTHGLVDGSVTPTRVDISKVNAKGLIY